MATAKKITIHDVALAAGVSVSTVSLVLSGKGRISTATGERVNAAIEELGFVRNRQASALRGGQSGVIGLIVRDLSAPFPARQGRRDRNGRCKPGFHASDRSGSPKPRQRVRRRLAGAPAAARRSRA